MIDNHETSQFEQDLLNNTDLINLILDKTFAQNLYASLCNVGWVKNECMFHCTWRRAGGIVANIRNVAYNFNESYLDYYCSGYEGTVFEDVKDVLCEIGWFPVVF